jgi:hypothetical protein
MMMVMGVLVGGGDAADDADDGDDGGDDDVDDVVLLDDVVG